MDYTSGKKRAHRAGADVETTPPTAQAQLSARNAARPDPEIRAFYEKP
jgi:hypothetical protein